MLNLQNIRLILFITFFIFCNKIIVGAQEKKNDSINLKKRIYTTFLINEKPIIDGKLDDECWKTGEWQSDYTQFAPKYNSKSSLKTDLKILYDENNIYVAIRAYDEIEKITKRLNRRDQYSGDIVGIHLDSYFDHRTAYEFDITSAGQKLDVWVSNDSWDMDWNSIWEGKVAYESNAWTAEFKIPLNQLRYNKSEKQIWGLNSWRKIDRLQEEDHWNLVANDGTGLVYTFGELHGLDNLKSNKRFEISPFISNRIETNRGKIENPLQKKIEFNYLAGIDAKIGIGNNFTIDTTINPDFGQIEADPSVMNLTAFETLFEEKRPFFVEGKNIFDFNFDQDKIFYSRRIGKSPSFTPSNTTNITPEFTTIGGAIKLSGKTSNGISLGILESLTLKENAEIFENDSKTKLPVEPLTNYFVGRIQKDYNKGNTLIGGIITNTNRFINDKHLDFLAKNSSSIGIDLTHFWKERKYFLEIKTIGTSIFGNNNAITKLQTSSARYYQRPDIKGITLDSLRTTLNGFGTSFKIGKWSKGNWKYNEEIIYKSPGLEFNDLGYMNLSNIIKNNSSFSYYERNNKGNFKNYNFTFNQENSWNTQFQYLYSAISGAAETELLNGWYFYANTNFKFNSIDEKLLRGGPSFKLPQKIENSWIIKSNSSKKIYFSMIGNFNKTFENKSELFNISTSFNYRLFSNLSFTIQNTFLKNRDELQYVSQANYNGTKKYILANIFNKNLNFTIRIDWAITPEFTIQYYGSPFISIGKFSDFKLVQNPKDIDYKNRFTLLSPSKDGNTYNFDFNNDGKNDYQILNPDFNYQQFRSNLVLRWEYKAGSTIYLVWSQNRNGNIIGGDYNFNSGLENLSNIYPKNIFIFKINYWFSK